MIYIGVWNELLKMLTGMIKLQMSRTLKILETPKQILQLYADKIQCLRRIKTGLRRGVRRKSEKVIQMTYINIYHIANL